MFNSKLVLALASSSLVFADGAQPNQPAKPTQEVRTSVGNEKTVGTSGFLKFRRAQHTPAVGNAMTVGGAPVKEILVAEVPKETEKRVIGNEKTVGGF
jgi:hypothetical protein